MGRALEIIPGVEDDEEGMGKVWVTSGVAVVVLGIFGEFYEMGKGAYCIIP